MNTSKLSIREREAFSAAANAGARSAVIAGAAFSASKFADDIATFLHSISLAAVEKEHLQARELHSNLQTALDARRAAFAEASTRLEMNTSGNSGALIFGLASSASWIQAALGLPAVVLRIRLFLANARSVRLEKKRNEVSTTVKTYTSLMEGIFTDYKTRAETLKHKTDDRKEKP